MNFQNYYFKLGYELEKQAMEKTASVGSEQLGGLTSILGPAVLGALIGGGGGALIGGGIEHAALPAAVGGAAGLYGAGLLPAMVGGGIGAYADDAKGRQKNLSKDFSLTDLFIPGKAMYGSATRQRALLDRLGYSK